MSMAAKTTLPAVITACVLLSVLSGSATAGKIGLNWGRVSAQRLVPSMVVDLLLQNNISAARVYTAQEDILKAFAGSGIILTLGIYQTHSIGSMDAAKKWVQLRRPYLEVSNVRFIVVGNGVFQDGIKNRTILTNAVTALTCIQAALNDAGLGGKIKATIGMTNGIFKSVIARPSEAEFRDEMKNEILNIINTLRTNGCPLFIEMFPISYVTENPPFSLDFAFMHRVGPVVTDVNGKAYTNVVEFLFDSYVWAMRKYGIQDMNLVIGNIGWPTDGYPGANTTTAERFYKTFLPWVAGNRGTPLWPGRAIDVYINSIADENKMPYLYPFSRHWGIYTSYGAPKYKIDLSGQGRDIYPTKAKGIMQMPERWCVFNGNMMDVQTVEKHFKFACSKADCTSLAPGGSCSKLTYAQNVSYAFNMYFQSQFQDEKSCVFGGFGTVATSDPTVGLCIYPVEVVKGQQDLGNDGTRIYNRMTSGNIETFILLLSLFWTLIWN